MEYDRNLFEKDWVTSEYHDECFKRHKLYEETKNKPENAFLVKEYKRCCNRITNRRRKLKRDFYSSKFDMDLSGKPWKLVKDIFNNAKSATNRECASLKVANIIYTDADCIANKFNQFFTSIAVKLDKDIPDIQFSCQMQQPPNTLQFFSLCTTNEVCKIIVFK